MITNSNASSMLQSSVQRVADAVHGGGGGHAGQQGGVNRHSAMRSLRGHDVDYHHDHDHSTGGVSGHQYSTQFSSETPRLEATPKATGASWQGAGAPGGSPGENCAGESEEAPRQFTETEIEDLRRAFKAFDEEDTGVISLDNMAFIFKGLGHLSTDYTEERVQEMVQEIDEDNSGTVDFAEFLSFVVKHSDSTLDGSVELQGVFGLLDRDDIGLVRLEEVRFLLLKLGMDMSEEEIASVMATVTPDENGCIDIVQFKQMISGLT